MAIKLLIFLGLNAGVFGLFTPNDDANEYDRTPTPEFIKQYGYPVEIHEVVTEDGYILEVHRIPHGLNGNSNGSRPAVYVQHGLFCSSAEFVYQTPEKGLAFILADSGFDVWLGNSRGNNYSRKHTTLDPDKDSEFWDFSWHEMGVYDVPAITDLIRTKTNQSKILYIGHSQGTTDALVANVKRPELVDKIKAFFLLAPIAYLFHTESPIVKLPSIISPVAVAGSKAVGSQEFYPSDSIESAAVQAFCTALPSASEEVCGNAIFFAFGFDREQFNKTLLPRILGHTPNGCSTKQILHYAQGVNENRFREYDNGPDYDLSKVTIPTYLYSGQNDWLAAIPDLERLKSELGNLKHDYRVPFDKFNHGDFLFANDVIPLLYDRLIEDMKHVAAEGTGAGGARGNNTEAEGGRGNNTEAEGARGNNTEAEGPKGNNTEGGY